MGFGDLVGSINPLANKLFGIGGSNTTTANPANRQRGDRVAGNFVNFLEGQGNTQKRAGTTSGQATFEDFIRAGTGTLFSQPGGNFGREQPGSNLIGNISAFGGTGLPLGFASLNNILAGQGRSDPRLLNREFTNIDRNTESQQQALTSRLAKSGFQNSGVGATLGTLIDQSGAERKTKAEERDIAISEQRKRQDLAQLFGPLLLDPSIDLEALNLGQFNADRSRNDQQNAAMIAALGTALAACWVARAIYGVNDPRWLDARLYVLFRAPRWFRWFYCRYGERIAETVKRRPWMKRLLRPLFDRFVRQIREECHGT